MNELIGDHPAAVVLVFCLMWGVLVALGGVVMRFAKMEFARIQAKECEQDDRLRTIERDIIGEDSRIALLSKELRAHIVDEADMKKTLQSTHDAVLRIGNGQMLVLNNKLDNLTRKVERIDQKVEAHNSEAETWKRRIEKNEVRLGHLEGGK
jgi:chromosome segregation ATPase